MFFSTQLDKQIVIHLENGLFPRTKKKLDIKKLVITKQKKPIKKTIYLQLYDSNYMTFWMWAKLWQ